MWFSFSTRTLSLKLFGIVQRHIHPQLTKINQNFWLLKNSISKVIKSLVILSVQLSFTDVFCALRIKVPFKLNIQMAIVNIRKLTSCLVSFSVALNT